MPSVHRLPTPPLSKYEKQILEGDFMILADDYVERPLRWRVWRLVKFPLCDPQFVTDGKMFRSEIEARIASGIVVESILATTDLGPMVHLVRLSDGHIEIAAVADDLRPMVERWLSDGILDWRRTEDGDVEPIEATPDDSTFFFCLEQYLRGSLPDTATISRS